MYQNFGISILSSIKFPVSSWCLINRDVVRDDKRRLRFAGNNHISQISIVFLDVALTSADGQSLFKDQLSLPRCGFHPDNAYLLEQFSKTNQQHTLSRILIWSSWIAWNIQAWNTNSASRSRDLDAVLQND
jgi:hypothetical protein